MKSVSSLKGIIFVLLSTFIFAGAPDWDCDGNGIISNYNDYQNTGSITAGIFLDGINEVNEGDLFAAFVGDELRGVGALSLVPDVFPVFGEWAGQYQFALYIYSNAASGETMTFRYYDSETDTVYDISDTYEFVTDMTEGSAIEPIIFNFNSSDVSSDACITCDGDDCSGSADGGDDGGDLTACDLPTNNLYLDGGDVWYNVDFNIGGFQWNIDGATVSATSGGDAAAAGFTVQGAGSTVLGFSFTGGTVQAGCGTLTQMSLSGDATGLSGIVFSDEYGNQIDVFYYEGGSDDGGDDGGDPVLISIPPGNSEYLWITFNPDSLGDINGELEIVSNDPESPVTVNLSGHSICIDEDEDEICDDIDDCVGEYDCFNNCNGDAFEDPDGDCCYDMELDDCGYCYGDNECHDCLGVPYGDDTSCIYSIDELQIDYELVGSWIMEYELEGLDADCSYDEDAVQNPDSDGGAKFSDDGTVRIFDFEEPIDDENYWCGNFDFDPETCEDEEGCIWEGDEGCNNFDIYCSDIVSENECDDAGDGWDDNGCHWWEDQCVNNNLDCGSIYDEAMCEHINEYPLGDDCLWMNNMCIVDPQEDCDNWDDCDEEGWDSVCEWDEDGQCQWDGTYPDYTLNWGIIEGVSSYSLLCLFGDDVDEININDGGDSDDYECIEYYINDNNSFVIVDIQEDDWMMEAECELNFWTQGCLDYENEEVCNFGEFGECVESCGDPEIQLSLYDIDFGDVYISESETRTVTIENTGLANLEIYDVTSNDNNFIVNGIFESSPLRDGACDMPVNTISLDGGDVWYNVDFDIGGFQWDVDGATVTATSGGDAAAAGFTVQGAGSTVLGFSFTGGNVSAGCGTLTQMTLSGDATGLSGIVFSDTSGSAVDVTYYENYDIPGCTDENACNYDADATAHDDSCVYIQAGECDCDGSVEDECGICGGDSSSCQEGCNDPSAYNYGSPFDCCYESGTDGFDCNWNCDGIVDCGGYCGGNNYYDDCGECVGSEMNNEPCEEDDTLVLQPGETYDFEITFMPYSTGYDSGVITVSSNAANLLQHTNMINVSGWGIDTDDEPENPFDYYQSSMVSFYLFDSVTIDQMQIDNDDWVVAFRGDVCVGATQWNTDVCLGNVCDIAVMGDDGTVYTQNYMLEGEMPEFKIYDSSTDILYNAMPSEENPWSYLSLYHVENLNGNTYGCTDSNAVNYDASATFDDATCYYEYIVGYDYGANLTSFYVLPDSSDSYSSIDFVNSTFNISDYNLYSLISQNQIAYFAENGNVYGGLIDVNRDLGYWVKSNNSIDVPFVGYKTNPDIVYSLIESANLISFPYNECPGCENECILLEDALPDEIEGIVYAIFSEDDAAIYQNGGWYGSLMCFDGFKGYWFRSYENIDFQFNIPDEGIARAITPEKEILSGYEFNNSSQVAFYFIENLPQAQIGDWVIAMNDGIVVGARKWTGSMIDIPAMGDDGESYSYGYLKSGESPQFMLYHNNTGELTPLYGTTPGFISNEVFVLDELTDENAIQPTTLSLGDAYPNPFNPVTNITFSVPEMMNVELNVIDIQGRLVERIAQGMYQQGTHHMMINGENLSSGVYFVQFIADDKVTYKKVMLLK